MFEELQVVQCHGLLLARLPIWHGFISLLTVKHEMTVKAAFIALDVSLLLMKVRNLERFSLTTEFCIMLTWQNMVTYVPH